MSTQVQIQSSLQRKIDDYNRGQLVARLDHSCNHPAVIPSSANFESLSYRRGYIEYLKRYRLGIEYTASYTIDAGQCTLNRVKPTFIGYDLGCNDTTSIANFKRTSTGWINYDTYY